MYDNLAEIFEGFAHPVRIAILSMIETKSLREISVALKISRPGLQRHVNQLSNLGLIRKDKGRKFFLTELGTEARKLIEGFEVLATKIDVVKREKTEMLSLQSLDQTMKTGFLKPNEVKKLLSKAVSTGALKSPDAKDRAKLMLRSIEKAARRS